MTSRNRILSFFKPIMCQSQLQQTTFFFFFSEKTNFEISCESSAWQTIHMKCQDLFSLKNKKKILECCLLQILFGAVRVKMRLGGWMVWAPDFSSRGYRLKSCWRLSSAHDCMVSYCFHYHPSIITIWLKTLKLPVTTIVVCFVICLWF